MLRQVQWYIIQDIDQNDKNPNNFIIVKNSENFKYYLI